MWIQIAVRVVVAIIIMVVVALYMDKRKGYKRSKPAWKQLSCDCALVMLGAMALLLAHKSGVAFGFAFLILGGCAAIYTQKSLKVQIHGVRILLFVVLGNFIGTGFLY